MFKAAIHEEIKVPAQIDHLGDLRNFVTKAGRKHNFPPSVVNAFKLGIDEAATNIIKHAYRDWAGMITLRVIVKKNSMTVILIDQGKYFDPSRVDDPDLKRYVDIGKKGGLGIFMMRRLLDEIDYQHTEEGNELRLTKYRESSFRKKQEVTSRSSAMSRSLKTRNLFTIAAILTIAVAVGYFFFFFIHGKRVFNDFVITTKVASEEVARIIVKGNEKLDVFSASPIVDEYIKERKEIYRLIFMDENDHLVYTTDENLFIKFFNSEYKIPTPNQQVRPFLFRYKNTENIGIYSFVSNIYNNDSERRKIGTVYLDVKKEYVGKKIAAQRLRDLQVALIVLVIGYAGTFILVYIIMNPFRKLANWVKDLGSGNAKDEIDFDSSDEAGAIAKAFSQMTDKVRESQKNLAEQERIRTEMQVGKEIQQQLIPREVPNIEGYEISPYYEAAKELGGDYFDFIEVDKDTLGIVVADVSGKGVPGSLVMAYIKATLRTEARSMKSASEVLARVNDIVVDDMKKGMFVTLFYVIIDSKRRRINYASAGHNPMILSRQGTKKTYYLNPRGFPVGISLPDADLFKNSIESDTIQLSEDDILLLYTDGITEAMNSRRAMFGEERLLDAIQKHGHLKADEFINKLKDEIHSFTEGYEQSDDITVVAIKEKSTQEKIELTRAQAAHRLILAGKSIREACESVGITTYAYYNKYKKVFEEEGIDAYSIDENVSVEAKHLSIEEKTKIYDIIKKHPEYGAKRISEELNIEAYGFCQINESRIYDELVRSRLNTRQLREAYIARSGRKKRMKPPGTPMLTLDGKIILSKDMERFQPQTPEPDVARERKPTTEKQEKPVESKKQKESKISKDADDEFYLESMMALPLEDLLEKRREVKEEAIPQPVEEIAVNSPAELEAEESDVVDFLEEEEETGQIFDEATTSHSQDDKSLFEEESDEIEIEEDKEASEEIGLDQELSFRNIWDEEDIDISEPEIIQKDTEEDIEIVEKNQIKDNIKTDEPSSSSAESPADIDDILEDAEVTVGDEIGFEMLPGEISFKGEIFLERNGDDGQLLEGEDNLVQPIEQPQSDGLDSEDLSHEVTDDELDQNDEDKSTLTITTVDDSDLLEEEEKYAESDFSFDDLLNEIENDITFFDHDTEVENEIEFAYENKLQAQKVNQMTNDAIDNRTIGETRNGHSLQIQKNNRLREKHLALGLKFYQQQNYKLAVEQFLKVIELFPDFKEAYSILGNAYYRTNQIDQAIKSYERVKQIDPFDVDAYENTGVIYANIGKFKDEIKELKNLLEFKPDRKDIMNHIKKAEEFL